MVLWLIGMSGAGKSAVGTALVNRLKHAESKWTFIDGDLIRDLHGDNLGHTIEDRAKNSHRIRDLCLLQDKQGLNVVACVLSIFPEHQLQNRSLFSKYVQVYLKTSMETLLQRDQKGLYKKAREGVEKNVVGVDIKFPEPEQSDLVVETDKKSIEQIADEILDHLGLNLNLYPYSQTSRWTNKFEKYQYTPYLGSRFLEDYQDSRHKALQTSRSLADSKKPAPVQISQPTIWELVKKFEVQKKIGESASDHLEAAHCVADSLEKTSGSKALILFNALLKMNDKIIAIYADKLNPAEQLLFSACLKSEMDFFRKLHGR